MQLNNFGLLPLHLYQHLRYENFCHRQTGQTDRQTEAILKDQGVGPKRNKEQKMKERKNEERKNQKSKTRFHSIVNDPVFRLIWIQNRLCLPIKIFSNISIFLVFYSRVLIKWVHPNDGLSLSHALSRSLMLSHTLLSMRKKKSFVVLLISIVRSKVCTNATRQGI